MKTITILIPCYNEEEVLPALFERLNLLIQNNPKYCFELLFVNDGSRDQTLKLIKQEAKSNRNISYIDLARNFGKEVAMMAGIDNIDSDAMVIIDADLQDPPELIPEMINIWQDGYDDVYARRKSRAGESWFKKFSSNMYYKILQKMTSVDIQLNTGDFRLFDKKCIQALQHLREANRNSKALFSWIGYRKKEILYDRDPRLAGQTKWNYWKLINLAIDGITSFTVAPLRVASILGFIISFFAFCYALIIFFKTVVMGIDLPGYASMMVVVLLLGGVQLLSLGIIGEYIGRIFVETKQRPAYLIMEIKRAKNKK